jgi:hypothetical protein
MDLLRLGVALAAVWAVVALLAELAATLSYGRRQLLARSAGAASAGVVYAFGRGLLPGAKESVQRHLPTFVAGLVYHAGIFAAFALLLLSLVPVAAPPGAGVALALVAAAGALAGLVLISRRALTAHLRAISHVDDWVANLLATAFAASGALATTAPTLRPLFWTAAILLLLYVPVGKIRHCAFFFLTRFHFGAFFGRRGVLPPGGRIHA